MRTHSFEKQQRIGRIGEKIILKHFPEYKWLAEDPKKSTPYDFETPNGNYIELKTCKTYPKVYINNAIMKKGKWSLYGPRLSAKNKVDEVYYLFIDSEMTPLRLVSIKTKALVRAMSKANKTLPRHHDSNKETWVYDIDELLSTIKKGVSWNDIELCTPKRVQPYSVLLTPQEASNRSLWLKTRSQGLGCSDVYTLTGKSKWKTVDQLLDEKVFGLREEITDPATLQRFWWGHAMEPLLTDWWNEFKEQELGKAEEWQALLKSNLCAGLVGTPDAKCGDKLIEYKTTSPRTYTNSWQSGRRVPEHYYYQVQAQMLLTGMNTCYVVVARAIGIAPKILKVEKDQKLIDNIQRDVESFWKKVVKERERHGINEF